MKPTKRLFVGFFVVFEVLCFLAADGSLGILAFPVVYIAWAIGGGPFKAALYSYAFAVTLVALVYASIATFLTIALRKTFSRNAR
ncbi:MAG TPA: hypothetical protein VF786_00250 [Terriglobales bacterium]